MIRYVQYCPTSTHVTDTVQDASYELAEAPLTGVIYPLHSDIRRLR